MIKTITLTANQEKEVELTGGCHAKIENRGDGVIYASKSSGITADSDGVTAIDSGNAKVLRNVAQYRNNDNSYDYYGKIYLLSDSDTKAEIQTANDLNFFSRKNSAKGGETIDAYTKAETDIRITEKVAEIVADAPEDFDTLKEMSDWIASHENDASAMNSAIQSNANNISSLQTDKVGFTDYATANKAGVVKANSTYGAGKTSNNEIMIICANESEISSGSNIYKPIVPANLSKAMAVYGINSKTQIADMQTKISNKVDVNLATTGDNLIAGYGQDSGLTTHGLTVTYSEVGEININGVSDDAGSLFFRIAFRNAATQIPIDKGIYILSLDVNADFDKFKVAIYCHTDTSQAGTLITPDVFRVRNKFYYIIDNSNGGYKFINHINLATNGKDVEFNNIKIITKLEPSISTYQPYKLSRQALRDDIDRILTALNLTQEG